MCNFTNNLCGLNVRHVFIVVCVSLYACVFIVSILIIVKTVFSGSAKHLWVSLTIFLEGVNFIFLKEGTQGAILILKPQTKCTCYCVV